MDDRKKVIAWHAASEAEDRAHVPKTNWLWQVLVMLCVLFVCISTGWTSYHFAVWIGTGTEWAGLISICVSCVTYVAIAKPS